MPSTPGKTNFTFIEDDCCAAMAGLPAESMDVVVTSPPYNLGIRYSTYDDSQARTKYLDWSLQWASEVKRLLKETGSFFLNVGGVPANPLLPHELILRLSGVFVLQNTFHWIKSISIQTTRGESISAGHFKPIHSGRYVTDCHEFIFHLTKTGSVPLDRLAVGVPYADKSNIARWKQTQGQDLRCRGNTWFIPYETILSRARDRPHPATFPTELAVRCLKIHGLRPDLRMLDPFVGLGHSALAAKACGIESFIGIDIDPEYLALAQKAVASEAPAPARGRRRKKERPQPAQTGLNL